jgi:hypothetical protein
VQSQSSNGALLDTSLDLNMLLHPREHSISSLFHSLKVDHVGGWAVVMFFEVCAHFKPDF